MPPLLQSPQAPTARRTKPSSWQVVAQGLKIRTQRGKGSQCGSRRSGEKAGIGICLEQSQNRGPQALREEGATAQMSSRHPAAGPSSGSNATGPQRLLPGRLPAPSSLPISPCVCPAHPPCPLSKWATRRRCLLQPPFSAAGADLSPPSSSLCPSCPRRPVVARSPLKMGCELLRPRGQASCSDMALLSRALPSVGFPGALNG